MPVPWRIRLCIELNSCGSGFSDASATAQVNCAVAMLPVTILRGALA